jgi:hypothetical protein
MITQAELIRAFVMCGRLLRFDLRGAALVGKDGASAWASLRVFIILLPLVILTSWPTSPEFFTKTGLSPLTFTLIAGLQVMISVLGFYLLVAHITRRLGIPERLAHYICVQNWGSLPVWLVLAGFTLLSRQLGLAGDESGMAEFLLRLFLLYYSFAMTSATLGLRKLPTAVLCLLELFFGHFIQLVTASILALTLASA